MLKIGILGSDNSHALAFAKLCNIPDENGKFAFDNVRVSAIYGKDDKSEHTKEVAANGKIEFIADKPEDFFGKVDAVMVVYRRGSYHVNDILPFAEAGLPVWIDKPIASDVEDLEKLRTACEKHNTLVTGGSTVKFCQDVIALKECAESGSLGNILGGNMNFPADTNSEYDGIFFYASHLVEIMCTVFGYDVKSIIAAQTMSNRISVIAKYATFQITLNFNASNEYFATVYGDKKSITAQLDISDIYRLGFEKFIEMINSGKMPLSLDKLLKPVYIIDAINKSLKENKEIIL